MTDWEKAQAWEKGWWNLCINTYGEEEKQLLYASKMGLTAFHDGKSPYNFDLGGISVVDIGGGPCSLLLKCVNFERAIVIDPLSFPRWVLARYEIAGIEFMRGCGEDLSALGFDEAWIYNTLQHVEDPQHVIFNTREAAALIRLFEWIDMAASHTHPRELTEAKLNLWLHGEGKVETVHQNGCFGRVYYGVFPS